MADRRQTVDRHNDPETYDSRLYDVGALWETTSRRTGRPILTGTLSRGVVADPIDILITENAREDRSDNAPSHRVFIRIPRRGANANGNSDGPNDDKDGLSF
jgi:hypothetical protein